MKKYIKLDYPKEKRILKNKIPKIYEILKDYNCYIAGGSITSIFTNTEINDIDVYFKSKTELFNCLIKHFDGNYIVYLTKKAITFKISEINVQFIFMNYYKKAQDIFKDFDFTVCMGAFDIQEDKFVLHNDFLKDIAQKRIVFNPETAFPVVSGLRIKKYQEKGFTIDILELTKILLTINNLKIKSYDDLEKQLGGLYGENIIEEIDKSKTFNLLDIIK